MKIGDTVWAWTNDGGAYPRQVVLTFIDDNPDEIHKYLCVQKVGSKYQEKWYANASKECTTFEEESIQKAGRWYAVCLLYTSDAADE